MIEKELIDQARRTDVAALVRAKGIDLKKTGKSLMGLCPFHADSNPSLSINTKENYWKCFGCGEGGDAIHFVELFDQVEFTEAVARLSNGSGRLPKVPKKPAGKKRPAAKPLSVKDKKLLARVVKYYQHSLDEDKRGLDYLQKERGINDVQSIKELGAGYVNGTLNEILPDDRQVIDQLKRIGILNAKGNEVFYNCVVFPLFDGQGAPTGLYGRNIADNAKVPHLYLAGPRTGILNRAAAKHSRSVFLTESIIDALTLYDRGYKNVIPIYGVNGLTDAHLKLLQKRVKSIHIVFDADDPGRKAADSVSSKLEEKGIECHSVTLPEKDVNIYFKSHSPRQFEKLLKQGHPSIDSPQSDKKSQDTYNPTDHGFIAGFEDRQYAIKGIGRGATHLKAVVEASRKLGDLKIPFELTTIDFYSSRSRSHFTKLCADLFEADQAVINQDMGKLLSLVENYKPQQKTEDIVAPSKAERSVAKALLKNPKLFDEILCDLETLGVVGEQTNKIVCYLTAISRKLEKPLSVLIQSRSSAGKSTVQNAVLRLVPEEDYESYTRVTDQALFYKEEGSLVHKILAIEEDAGVGGAAYSIRNMQSAGKITVATTGKDPATGKMKTENYEVKGPVAVMLTTTSAELDQETASRFISLSIDESAEMTRAIHEKQRQARTSQGLIQRVRCAAVVKKHHTAQRLLKPIAVVNNFDRYLSYPSDNIVTRRDHDKYLGLIEAIAYLRQYQRKTKTMDVDGRSVEYIEVTLEDIDRANALADEVLGRSLDELSRPSRTLLDAVYKMVKKLSEQRKAPMEQIEFNRRQIREYIGWSDWQIKVHIKQLEQLEYLYVRMGSRGKTYSYALNYEGQGAQGGRFYLNLTSVEEIKKLMKKDKDKN
jgi:DNA primase